MPELIEAIILGIVQGITEFLPVSSSGHIEIAEYLMGHELQENSVALTVLLHFATALATIIYYRKDIWQLISQIHKKPQLTYILMIIVSMVPAAIIGLFFDEIVEQLFDGRLLLVGFGLLFTGFVLLIADRKYDNTGKMTYPKAFVTGVAQAVALIPGISRSGSTIGTALLLSIERSEAARFSFLMVVPLILGKMAKDLLGGEVIFGSSPMYYSTAFAAAFISGLLACAFMVAIVKKAQLKYFSYYCFIIAIAIIALHLL